MADRVEMAVCEACGRVFHPASMRGPFCISCSLKHVAPKKDETPIGFKKVACLCCGSMFLAPRASTADYCWKCSDRRQRAAERRRKRKLCAPPAGMEWHVCQGCGETFARKVRALGRPHVYCAKCVEERGKAANRRAQQKYLERLRKEAAK